MRKMHDGKLCEKLWTAIQTIPFRLSEDLQKVGPVARLQMLFNIVNRYYSELKDHTTCVAQQMNKDLAYLVSLEHLETIDLGEKGAAFVENIYKMLSHKQLQWQTYGAAIIFGSHRPWITCLLRT